MKFKKIFLLLILILMLIRQINCEKYTKLKVNDVPSIKKSDLPLEFSDKAFKVIDEFILKEYGNLLKNYINNKNINKLQLIRREYSNDHENC